MALRSGLPLRLEGPLVWSGRTDKLGYCVHNKRISDCEGPRPLETVGRIISLRIVRITSHVAETRTYMGKSSMVTYRHPRRYAN